MLNDNDFVLFLTAKCLVLKIQGKHTLYSQVILKWLILRKWSCLLNLVSLITQHLVP